MNLCSTNGGEVGGEGRGLGLAMVCVERLFHPQLRESPQGDVASNRPMPTRMSPLFQRVGAHWEGS